MALVGDKDKHREWVVKELTAHGERLKHIFIELKGIVTEMQIQNGRVRELDKQVSLHKGAGIFISCLFTILMGLFAYLS